MPIHDICPSDVGNDGDADFDDVDDFTLLILLSEPCSGSSFMQGGSSNSTGGDDADTSDPNAELWTSFGFWLAGEQWGSESPLSEEEQKDRIRDMLDALGLDWQVMP